MARESGSGGRVTARARTTVACGARRRARRRRDGLEARHQPRRAERLAPESSFVELGCGVTAVDGRVVALQVAELHRPADELERARAVRDRTATGRTATGPRTPGCDTRRALRLWRTDVTAAERTRGNRPALLHEGSLRVWEVAEAVGYSQAAQFAKAFRRHYGCPPSALRAAASLMRPHDAGPSDCASPRRRTGMSTPSRDVAESAAYMGKGASRRRGHRIMADWVTRRDAAPQGRDRIAVLASHSCSTLTAWISLPARLSRTKLIGGERL
jgi:Helix-turn-helix domain